MGMCSHGSYGTCVDCLQSEARYGSRLTCEDCKKQKPDVKETKCPYDMDVHDGLETPATLCDACYHERGMAI